MCSSLMLFFFLKTPFFGRSSNSSRSLGGMIISIFFFGTPYSINSSIPVGVSARNIARWDGSTWDSLGSGVNDDVLAIAVSGSDVYVGGMDHRLRGFVELQNRVLFFHCPCPLTSIVRSMVSDILFLRSSFPSPQFVLPLHACDARTLNNLFQDAIIYMDKEYTPRT